MLVSAIAVGLGGAIGAISRFLINTITIESLGPGALPLATLAVNVLGSLLIGVLGGLGERFEGFPLELRLFFTTGILGGFTTFSAFSMETASLIRKGESALALGNVAANLTLGMLAVFLGFWLGRSYS